MSHKSSNSFFSSFINALNGIKTLISTERNARIHFFAAVIVVLLGLFFRVSVTEWSLLLLCIGLVISLEGVNSSLEGLADIVQPEWDEKIKIIKDMAAGAVLISAAISALIGLFIFIPKLLLL